MKNQTGNALTNILKHFLNKTKVISVKSVEGQKQKDIRYIITTG